MHSSALLLVLKVQHIDSALLVGESTSSRARCAASSFTNKALRSSNLGSSRSSVNYGTTGRGEAKNGVETFTTSTQEHPTHSLGTRKYPLQGEKSMELQLIRTQSIFHQGVGRNLPNGHEENRTKGHEEKRFKSRRSKEILSLHRKRAPAQDGISRNSGSIYSVGGLREQLEI